MDTEPHNKLSLEWVKGPDGIALVFDKRTWNVFEQAASRNEQSGKHMITRAVVGCIGSILEDNLLLNQILRGSS